MTTFEAGMKTLTHLLLLIASFFCSIVSVAQPSDAAARLSDFDHTEKAQAANAFFRHLKEEGMIDHLIQFADNTPTDTLRQQVWYWAADYFYSQQQYQEAATYALKALPFFRTGNDRGAEADCLNLLAISYTRLADYDKAAKYARQVNRIDIAQGDPSNISSSFNTLAAIYMSARQPKEAEKYILKGIANARKAGDPTRLAILLGTASEIYHKLNQPAQALDYATQAYELERQQGRKEKAAVRQAQRASCLIALHRNKEARQDLEAAIRELRADGNLHSLGIACNELGMLLHHEHEDTAAARYLNEALSIFTKQHDLYNESYSLKGLYEALRKGNPALAMQHIDRYNLLRDSLYDRETGQLLSQYAAEYGYDELKAENEAQRTTHRRYFLAAILAMIMATGGAWLYRRRYRCRIHDLMEQIGRLSAEDAPCGTDSQPNAANPSESSGEDRQFLHQVINAVHDSLASNKTDVQSIAARLNMSVPTFRRHLQAAAGESPKAYISAIQMKHATHLLSQHPDWSIDLIAHRCGFEEASNFIRAFKRTYGITPLQYRKS